jgi:hypothetical protein
MSGNRFYWAGGTLLCLGATAFLWGENRELKGRLAERAEKTTAADSTSPGEDEPGRSPEVARRAPEQAEAAKPSPPFQPIQRPKRLNETAPVDSPVSRETGATDGDTAINKLEKSPGDFAPVEETTVEIVQLNAAQAESKGESLLKNGGFDQDLAPWICEGGQVTQEEGNPYLQITPKNGSFHLSQDLQRSPATRNVELSLRVRFSSEGQYTPIKVSMRTPDGTEQPVYTSAIYTSGEWKSLSTQFAWPEEPKAVGIVIEGDQAKTGFSIDDIILREVRAPSASAQK